MFKVIVENNARTWKNDSEFKTLKQVEKFVKKYFDMNSGFVSIQEDGNEIAFFNNQPEAFQFFKNAVDGIAAHTAQKREAFYQRHGLNTSEDQ